MIDTHCHIDLYPDPIAVANESELSGTITIGVTNLPSHFELGRPYLARHKKVRLALGMHPLYAEKHLRELPIFIRNIDNTSYIGEIGLDFSREGMATKELQVTTFKKVLKSLQGKRKLLSLHSRKAEKEVFMFLQSYNVETAIFHWYSGPLSLIAEISAAGYMFSVNPAMIKSKSGQEIIKRIPKENILTESDGPFITLDGAPTKPRDVEAVLIYLSALWKIPINAVNDVIQKNFFSLVNTLR
ncbi:TatD family hydrolase [Pontibacter sp. H249]|uniref:TatD family hydrolase n=1 Tax=Pontibacter sp. H249 TaxID=3133420 RepID=UPI0030C5D817